MWRLRSFAKGGDQFGVGANLRHRDCINVQLVLSGDHFDERSLAATRETIHELAHLPLTTKSLIHGLVVDKFCYAIFYALAHSFRQINVIITFAVIELFGHILGVARLKLEDLLGPVEFASFGSVVTNALNKLFEKGDAALVLYRYNVYRKFILNAAKTFRKQILFTFE